MENQAEAEQKNPVAKYYKCFTTSSMNLMVNILKSSPSSSRGMHRKRKWRHYSLSTHVLTMISVTL